MTEPLDITLKELIAQLEDYLELKLSHAQIDKLKEHFTFKEEG